MDEIVSLFRDWIAAELSLIDEGISPISSGAGMVADWRYFVAAEAKPRAERLGIVWSDDFISPHRLELMQDETP